MSQDVAESVNVQNTAEIESLKVHASKNYLANSTGFYLYSWSIAQHLSIHLVLKSFKYHHGKEEW